jgi:hypothetical protein
MICEIQVQIEQVVYDYLQQKFKISNRYQSNQDFIHELDLITERKVCENAKIIIDSRFFMTRLYRKKAIVYEGLILNGLLFLKLKFKKEEIVISTE